MVLLLRSNLGALASKRKIFAFLQGVTRAISGHLPRGHDANKTTPRKAIRLRKHPAQRIGPHRKPKNRKVGSEASRNGRLNSKPTRTHHFMDRSSLTATPKAIVYSCPACGLQATRSSMLEHLLGSPLHQPGRVQPVQTTDQTVKEDQAMASRKEDPEDSLRNLLQILLPPRPFGRRHEQKIVKL
jgi:hypothetical protein